MKKIKSRAKVLTAARDFYYEKKEEKYETRKIYFGHL